MVHSRTARISHAVQMQFISHCEMDAQNKEHHLLSSSRHSFHLSRNFSDTMDLFSCFLIFPLFDVSRCTDLEGDQLFGEIEPTTHITQEAPLALTNKPGQHQPAQIQVEMNPFLQFRTTSTTSSGATIVSQIHPHHSINNRPGVIVVKQN